MKVLVFTPYYLPGYKGGGPIKTIKNLFDTTSSRQLEYKLITSDRDLGDSSSYQTIQHDEWNQVGEARVFYIRSGFSGLKNIYSCILKDEYDLVCLNSFFSFRFSIYPRLLARINSKKVVLAPRGEFSEGALNIKSLKKRLFIAIYKMFRLHKGMVFQASTLYESRDIQRVLGAHVDIRIAENIGSQEFASNSTVKEHEALRLVFLSRISPKKNLLQAINILSKVSASVQFDIYGPIEDKAYWETCQLAMQSLPDHIKVEHKGSLSPDEVVQTLSSYDLFFLPTLGENYGHVIAEALCAGLPILISDQTPWRDLEKIGIGWDLALDAQKEFAKVIDDMAALDNDAYYAKRQHVLDWAQNKFSQGDAVEANIAMFEYAFNKK